MSRKIRGLFLNTSNAKCSIYESGKMSYACLKLSNTYSLDYLEVSKKNRTIPGTYDFYIFNYHNIAMSWLNLNCIKKLPGFKAVIVLEVNINDPFSLCPNNIFDAYLVLDPTIQSMDKKVYAFPRPLENNYNHIIDSKEPLVPTFGSFGFFQGDAKGFDKLIEAVNKEFDEAIVKINVLNPDWADDDKEFTNLINYLKNYPTKDGVKVVITSNYLTKEDLIKWCSENTLNAFFYNRHSCGLSATTDQAITSGRPLAVSTGFTFRHIHQYIKPYPFLSLKESIENGLLAIKKMQNDWSQENFVKKFERILDDNHIYEGELKNYNEIILPIDKTILIKEFFKKKLSSSAVEKIRSIKNNFVNKNKKYFATFVHPVVHSFSRLQEDLIIDFLFNRREAGFYLDIGAEDPILYNNTYRFYRRGWRGINIVSDKEKFSKFNNHRSLDINLEEVIRNINSDFVFLLGQIFSNHSHDIKNIDFMSLDIITDGLLILKSNDWKKYRPSVVIVRYNDSFEQIRFFMEDCDYMNIYNNNSNAFFVDKFTHDNDILKTIVWNNK